MKKIRLVATLSLLIASLFGIQALAQSGMQSTYPSGGMQSNAPYGRRVSQGRINDKDLEQLLKNLKDDAKSFRPSFEKALKNSSIRKTSREKDAKAVAQRFQDQTNGVYQQFKNSKQAPGFPEVQATARQIESLMNELNLAGEVTPKWEKIRPELGRVRDALN
jgi:hypothetical protein